jgi:hypothetical protein
MRNPPLRRLVIALASVLVIFAAFAAGIGLYVAALALWPLLLVWWPRLLAGVGAVVALGAWWLWWRLPKRQVDRLRLTIRDPKARADVEDNFRKTIGQLLGGAACVDRRSAGWPGDTKQCVLATLAEARLFSILRCVFLDAGTGAVPLFETVLQSGGYGQGANHQCDFLALALAE